MPNRVRKSLANQSERGKISNGITTRPRSHLTKTNPRGYAELMRFRLRTLLIVLALGPPVLAGAWSAWTAHKARKVEQARNHLRQIGLALQNYSSVYDKL